MTVQPRYLQPLSSLPSAAGIVLPSSLGWFIVDQLRDPCQIGLAVSDPATAGWNLFITMDDPTGTHPNPQLNPGAPAYGPNQIGGRNVLVFGSSQAGGWGGVQALSSTFSSPGGAFCFAGIGQSGNAVGGITQPVYALAFTSTANKTNGTTSSGIPTLTIVQAGPR